MIRRKLINFPDSSCDYRIGLGALDELSPMVTTIVGNPKRAVIVTSADLADGPGIAVSRALTDAGFRVSDLSFPAGEDVGTLAYAQQLFEALDGTSVTSDDLIVALGDARVCGIVQFCSRSWCGGTACVIIPTTLDGMATVATSMHPLSTRDSEGMVWLPSRPSMVVVDLNLVREELEAGSDSLKLGYLELMSSTLMDCRRAWEEFGDRLPGILAGEEIPLIDALCEAQAARLSVVKAPNMGARSAMLYGVTTARALRACLGDGIPWYRLLAEGMAFEARLGTDVGKITVEDVFEQDDRMAAMGIDELPFSISYERFLSALKETRFKRTNRFLFAIPHGLGFIRYAVVEEELLERHARAYLASRAELLDEDV